MAKPVRHHRCALGTALTPLLALALALALGAASAQAATESLKPVADTQAGGTHKRGHAKTLRVGAHPTRRALIRFSANDVPDTIQSARLRIRVSSSRRATLRVFARAARGKWSERSARLRAARLKGRVLARTRVKGHRWVTLNVTRAVSKRAVDFVIISSSRRGVSIASRESRSRPRLLVRSSGGPSSPGSGTAPPPPFPPTTRVLPPPSVFLSPIGSDSNPCTREAPCASVERGYNVAQPGQVVELAPGDYPQQDVSEDASKTSPDAVWLRSAPGTNVNIQELNIDGASNIAFLEIHITDMIGVHNFDPDVLGSHNLTFESMTAQKISMVGRVAQISVNGGIYGDTVDNQPQIGKANVGDPEVARPKDILINGATFRNFRRSASGVHTECLQVMAVDGLTVTNSRFNNCDGTGDIGITDGPSDNLTFENNFLGKDGDAFYSMQITKNVHNLVLRNNSASKAAIFSDSETGGPYTITGNYMPFSSALCQPEGTYSHNVFEGGTCGPTDVDAPAMRFVNEDAFDLHLAPNSEAINRGDPGSFPAGDIDGQARPDAGGPDAGADERR